MRPCVVILTGAWLVVWSTAAVTSAGSRPDVRTLPGRTPSGTINPNDAPWYELAMLPRIGEAKARAIVTYRDDVDHGDAGAVFHVADDLTLVSGIGPKTVQRLAAELRFHQ